MSRARRSSYKLGRILGDVEALEQGPTAYAKRRVRRKVYAKTNGLTRRLLRALGLSR